MKCPERKIECLNWTVCGCILESCPYENFNPYEIIDRMANKKEDDNDNLEKHWTDKF